VVGRVLEDLYGLQNGWRFFETAAEHLGLGPPWATSGNKVFVLKGSGLPVVLRKQDNHWVHVETCFILDLMNGEAAARVQSCECVIERVEIR
jgi:hypothetical protein